jgi:hypothetical protein
MFVDSGSEGRVSLNDGRVLTCERRHHKRGRDFGGTAERPYR